MVEPDRALFQVFAVIAESLVKFKKKKGKTRTSEMRLCSGAEMSIYGQTRRTHFSLTSVSNWAQANRGWAWMEGEQQKANSGQTRLVKELLTAALCWHLRCTAAGEACPHYWRPQGVNPRFRLVFWAAYSVDIYSWELGTIKLGNHNHHTVILYGLQGTREIFLFFILLFV